MVSESLIWTPPLKTLRLEWKISRSRRCPIPRRWPKWKPAPTAIADGTAGELVWLLEHPPIYTAGTSANDADLLDARFPVYRTGRGGQFTYHGPGQRVGYVMLDLKRRKPDVRAYVHDLEQWLIETLALFGVKGERREGRVGIWVQRGAREDKIAALGVRIRRMGEFHGVALNVEPGPHAFLRHRALRRARAWRHQPGRSGHAGDHGRCGCGAETKLSRKSSANHVGLSLQGHSPLRAWRRNRELR